jgi:hypothetical protein
MANLIALPSGACATLRRPEDVPERLHRPIRRAMARIRPEVLLAGREAASREYVSDQARMEAAELAAVKVGIKDTELDAFDEAQDATVVALVASWSYEGDDAELRDLYGRPVTVENVQDLPGRDYRTLRNVAARHVNAMFLDTSVSLDPASPTAPSNGSSSASVEGLSTTPQSTGAPTAS